MLAVLRHVQSCVSYDTTAELHQLCTTSSQTVCIELTIARLTVLTDLLDTVKIAHRSSGRVSTGQVKLYGSP